MHSISLRGLAFAARRGGILAVLLSVFPLSMATAHAVSDAAAVVAHVLTTDSADAAERISTTGSLPSSRWRHDARLAAFQTKPAAATRPSLQIEVTSAAGEPLDDVAVRVTGPVEREGRTDASGAVRLANLRSGTYRMRFEREGYVTFEREVTLPAATRTVRVDVALTALPEEPPPTVTELPPAPEPSAPPRPGTVRVLDVPAFIERNFIGRGEPQRLSTVGCAGQATMRVLQVRDPLDDRVNDEADVTLYTLAGEGTIVVEGRSEGLRPGTLAVIPRGTQYSLSRRGRNPVVVLSVLSGPACMEDVP